MFPVLRGTKLSCSPMLIQQTFRKDPVRIPLVPRTHWKLNFQVDEIIEDCFLKEETGCMNSHAANTFRPRARTHVVTYSSARNVLTGVIDQPAFFEALSNNFSRVLLWVLLHHQASKITGEFLPLPLQGFVLFKSLPFIPKLVSDFSSVDSLSIIIAGVWQAKSGFALSQDRRVGDRCLKKGLMFLEKVLGTLFAIMFRLSIGSIVQKLNVVADASLDPVS